MPDRRRAPDVSSGPTRADDSSIVVSVPDAVPQGVMSLDDALSKKISIISTNAEIVPILDKGIPQLARLVSQQKKPLVEKGESGYVCPWITRIPVL